MLREHTVITGLDEMYLRLRATILHPWITCNMLTTPFGIMTASGARSDLQASHPWPLAQKGTSTLSLIASFPKPCISHDFHSSSLLELQARFFSHRTPIPYASPKIHKCLDLSCSSSASTLCLSLSCVYLENRRSKDRFRDTHSLPCGRYRFHNFETLSCSAFLDKTIFPIFAGPRYSLDVLIC